MVRKIPKTLVQAWVILTALVATGCNAGSDLPDLVGTFEGTKTVSSRSAPSVAVIPEYGKTNRHPSVEFQISEILGSARSERYSIEIVSKDQIQIRLPGEASSETVTLKRQGDCAEGELHSQQVRFCWSNGTLDLSVVGADSSEVSSFHLVRTDGSLQSAARSDGRYTLDELVGRARFFSYSVSKEAERVYQARENVRLARANLLPRLNLRAVLGALSGDYLGAVGSVLPFIFPSSWYQVKANQDLARAESSSFSSLKGNEMNATELLFYSIQRDQLVLQAMRAQLEWMRSTQRSLALEEQVGTMPTGSSEYFGVSIAKLQQDSYSLATVVQLEFQEMAHAAALSVLDGVKELVPVSIPDLSQIQPIDARDYLPNVLEKSLELLSLNQVKAAAKNITKEVTYSFLDPEAILNVGFGLGSSIRISKSRQAEIQKTIDETSSLIEKKLGSVANDYNVALSQFSLLKETERLIQREIDRLVKRHLNGDPSLDEKEFLDALSDLQLKALETQADLANAQTGFLMADARLKRLLLAGFYKNLDDSGNEEAQPALPNNFVQDENTLLN